MDQITVKIDGMACSMCESHISETIRKAVPGAKKVAASHTKGEATFLSEGPVDLEGLGRAIEATGYHFLSAETAPYRRRGLFG